MNLFFCAVFMLLLNTATAIGSNPLCVNQKNLYNSNGEYLKTVCHTTKAETRDQGAASCQSFGMKIADPHNDDSLNALLDYVGNLYSYQVGSKGWIGGQLNGLCVILEWKAFRKYQLNLLSCKTLLGTVCEFKIPQATTTVAPVSSCPSVPKHYEEFGCTPIKEMQENGESCATSFDCSSMDMRDPLKCYYNNTAYSDYEELSAGGCLFSCFCQQPWYDGGHAKFSCAEAECFMDWEPSEKPCIKQFEQNGCCSVNEVCGKDLDKLAKCQFGGKTYFEGEEFESDCYKCLCQEGFENKPAEINKHCNKINCNIEVHYSDRIADGCIPIYYKTDDCCPIDWRCPDETTQVIATNLSQDSMKKCLFGNLSMNVGDALSPKDEVDVCTTCSCAMPPHPHCIYKC